MRSITRPLLGLAAVALASGCAREAREGRGLSWVGELGPDRLEGRVSVVGNEPFPYVLIEPEEGDPTVVTGVYRREIQRLSGARVRVTGQRVRGDIPQETIDATSYEIVSVDGDRPLVGRLERDPDGFYLARSGAEPRRVGFVSEPLQARIGSLVWIVLDDRGGVARYGILREAT